MIFHVMKPLNRLRRLHCKVPGCERRRLTWPDLVKEPTYLLAGFSLVWVFQDKSLILCVVAMLCLITFIFLACLKSTQGTTWKRRGSHSLGCAG
jgi:hypothetical protein